MELTKQKYKQTEVGLIPEDWNYLEFGKLISNLCYGPRFSSKDYSIDGNVKTIRGTDVNLLGDILYDQVPKAKLPYELVREHKLLDGDLVMITTADCGLTGVYIDDGFPYIASAYAVRISLNAEADPLFFKYIYQTNFAKKQIELYIRKGTVGNLPGSDIYKFKFPLPPTLEEQRAIATALSDVDELISNLDQLITKKKAIKQGTMQQLLTPPHRGGKRLAGFTGEWYELNLGENSILKARIGWQGLTTAEYLNSGDFFLITGTDFKGGYIDWDNCVYVEKNRYDQDKNIQIQQEDILVTKDGTIGKVAYINHVSKLTTLNSGVFVIRPIQKAYHPRFLYYMLMSKHFDSFLGKLTAGSTISHLYQKDFVHYNFPIPPNVEEQKAISEILFDMDEDIMLLQNKKIKYQAIKQGMMQELLTGKTRLV